MQKVNILGTEYEIIREAFEDETIDGFCDYTAHIIKVRNNNVSEVGDFEKLMKKQFGHEETIVDWFAIQFPKIMKVFKELEIL